jgi:hypothetical protein
MNRFFKWSMAVSVVASQILLVGCGGGSVPKDGLYMMTRYWSGSGLELDAYYFKGNQVVRSPATNIDGFDFDAARKAAPGTVGTYTRTADKMTITWGDGNKADSTVEMKAGDPCFMWNMGSFCPVTPFPAGAKLTGTFAGGAGSSHGGNAASNARVITFSADGTYQMDATSTLMQENALAAASTGQEQGTYQLNGTSLLLTPKQGAAQNLVVFPYTQNDNAPVKPDSLYFGGSMLKRR